MKDIFGKELKVGDTIITDEQRYAGLQVGVITRFTPKKIGVRYRNCRSDRLIEPHQAAYVEEEVAIVYWLKNTRPDIA